MATSSFIEAIQNQPGIYVACLEEIGYHQGWLSHAGLLAAAEKMNKTEYGDYLRNLIHMAKH